VVDTKIQTQQLVFKYIIVMPRKEAGPTICITTLAEVPVLRPGFS